jgi:prolipoprotein diacylglyceryltransferase
MSRKKYFKEFIFFLVVILTIGLLRYLIDYKFGVFDKVYYSYQTLAWLLVMLYGLSRFIIDSLRKDRASYSYKRRYLWLIVLIMSMIGLLGSNFLH